MALLVACQGPSPSPPPLRDCGAIADAIASAELGNYAPRERRAREVERLTAACIAADPGEDAAKCLLAARDRAGVAKCAANIPLDIDCDDVVAKVRATARKPAQLDPALSAQLERGYAVMVRACADDGWPLELKQCVLDHSRLDACADQMSKDLRDRLSTRIMESLR